MPIVDPARFSAGQKELFAFWLTAEITNTLGDRGALVKKWQDGILQWRAALPKNEKDFPWVGASNVEFPLTAMHSDPVYADFMQTLHAPRDYYSITALRSDRVAHANAMTETMTSLDRNFLHLRQVNGRALLDNNILGTAIYKNHWLHEVKHVKDYNREGRVEKVTRRRTHPLVEPVPLQYFLMPANAWDIDPDAPIGGAQWVAQEIHYTKNQLRLKAKADGSAAPHYTKEAVDKVLTFETHKENAVDKTIQTMDQFTPFQDRKIRLYEVWARFDVDGDGIEEDVVAIFHLESQTLLRVLHNPFLHGKRPFWATKYLPSFGFYGIGLSEADEWAQVTATKILNATIDNVLLSNTRMYSAPLGSNIMPGEPVYPGKIWFVGPGESIGEVKLGEAYPSIFQLQSQILQLAENRVGVSELKQGNLSGLPSRTPATSLLSMLREGNKRFDLILSNFRDVHSRMGTQILQNFAQQFHEDRPTWMKYLNQQLGPDDAAKVMEVLSGSLEDVESSFGVDVTATNQMVNKEVEKQSFIGLMQILQGQYQGLVQTAMLLPQLQPGTPAYETAVAAYTGGTQLLARLLEKFDIQNPQEYIPNLEALAGTLQAQAQGMNPAMAGMMPPQPGMMQPPAPQLGWEQMGALFGLQ